MACHDPKNAAVFVAPRDPNVSLAEQIERTWSSWSKRTRRSTTTPTVEAQLAIAALKRGDS